MNISAIPTNSNCGQADGSAVANVSGGTPTYSVKWFDDITLLNNIGNGNTINGLLAGTYYAQVIDQNGCESSVAVVINDNVSGTINEIHVVVTEWLKST